MHLLMFLQLPEKTFDAVKFMRQERDKLRSLSGKIGFIINNNE